MEEKGDKGDKQAWEDELGEEGDEQGQVEEKGEELVEDGRGPGGGGGEEGKGCVEGGVEEE